MIKLFAATAENLPLPEALAEVPGGCALLTSPSAYRVGLVEDGRCLHPTGPMDVSAVYEARVFTEDLELRWVEPGHAVVLTEREDLIPAAFADRIDPLEAEAVHETAYLVWGKATPFVPGWTSLHSSRVGVITVPVAHTGRERVRLAAREYIAADKAHGNAYVAEERLLRFEPLSQERTSDV
ncbi:CRISPR-associated protein Csx19 [Thermopolyspora sp. NPDC052614]|uniref:type III-D CRISPR-associated protein Csx19 n=1 Tax=Thermopolyspora sp. NPDC052614 TaxID=3155682 RepID=UPI0034326151